MRMMIRQLNLWITTFQQFLAYQTSTSAPNKDPLTQDLFYNNTALMVDDDGIDCGTKQCATMPDSPGAPFFWGNTLFTPSGNASNVTTCGKSLAYWQSRVRNGSVVFNTTTVHSYPKLGREVIDWAKIL